MLWEVLRSGIPQLEADHLQSNLLDRLLTVAAYPTLRNPVPPSRTVTVAVSILQMVDWRVMDIPMGASAMFTMFLLDAVARSVQVK